MMILFSIDLHTTKKYEFIIIIIKCSIVSYNYMILLGSFLFPEFQLKDREAKKLGFLTEKKNYYANPMA